MKWQKAVYVVAAVAAVVMLFSVPVVSAQSLMAMGEARITGQVFIQSADGHWMPAPTTYPVINGTVIRTVEGSAAIYFQDGSRISLLPGTEATISGEKGDYQITLLRGKIAYNIVPSASLSVTTPTGKTFSNGANEAESSTVGFILVCNNGTEVSSTSGTMTVGISGVESKTVGSGERIFAGADGKFHAYAGCGNGAGGAMLSSGAGAWPAYGALLAFGGGEAIAVKEAFRGTSGFASPSSPGSRRVK